MELKPGYKQTEVGVIPEDWDVQPLHSLSTKIMVGIASAATHAYRDSGVPMFRNQNIKEGWLDDSDLRFLDPAFDEAFQGKRLCGGDLLTARTGYPGTTAVVPPEYAGAQSFTSLIIRPDTSKISPSFLCLYINSPAGKAFFEQSQIGGAQKNVNANTLKRMPVAFPGSKEEQRAIASAVAEIDALTSSLEALISKKRGIKQAAMQELLTGKRRLPGFEGEWEGARLGELFKFRNGLNKAKEFFGKGTPIVNYMDVFNNSAIYVSTLRGRVLLTKQERQAFDVCKGDVFFTRTSETREDIGVASVVLGEVADTAFSGFLLRARPFNNRLEHGFKAYCFQSEEVRAQIVSKASYTTRALTNGRILSEVKMLVPPLPEQLAIASVLADMDAELTALEERLCNARELKQGMMQQLLTGKIRLK